MVRQLRWLAVLVACLNACGGGAERHPTSASAKKRAAPRRAAARDSAVETGGDAALADAGAPTHATNISFDTAAAIETGSTGVWPKRYSPTQADYYRFEAKAGDFYALWTET